MAHTPTLTLVPNCGRDMKSRPLRGSGFTRVKIRPQVVPTDPRGPLDLKDSLGGDSLLPLGDGLRGNIHQVSERGLGAGFGQKLDGSFHEPEIYTASLQLSTAGSLPSDRLPQQDQLMVDLLHKRVSPAPPPENFKTVAEWLIASTERWGMRSELGRYCGKDRQNVEKWVKGSLPTGPALRRDIAEWAQVPFESLRALFERDEEARLAIPPKARKRAASRPRLVKSRL